MRTKQLSSPRKRGDFSLRLALLGGVSILPVAFVFASPALAACPAAVSGNVTGPAVTTGGCNFAVAGGGVISGGSTGVINQVSIGTLTNNGSVSGSVFGVNNRVAPANQPHVIVWGAVLATPGNIGTLANTGVIAGGLTGIENSGGIGLLSNSGVIGSRLPGADFSGITNYGTIGAIDNVAEIYGAAEGIFNGGLIGSLSNSGTISGPMTGPSYATGIDNRGDIAQLTNTGEIAGAYDGVYSTGTIAALFNSGTIAGGRDGLALAAGEATNEAGGVIKGGAAGAMIGTPPAGSGTSGAGTSGVITGSGGSLGGLSNSGAITNVVTPAPAAVINNAVTPASGTAIVINDGMIEGVEGAVFTGAGNTLINAGTIISTAGGNAVDFGTAGENFLTLATGSVIEGTIYGGGTDGQITLDGNGAMSNPVADFGAGSVLEIANGADWTASGNWQIESVTNDGVFQPGVAGAALNLTGNFVQNPDGTLRVLVSPAASPFATTHFVITGTASLAGAVKYYFAPGTYKPGTVAFISATGGITGGFGAASYILPPAGLTGQTLIFSSDGDLRFAALTAVAPLDDSIFSDEIQSSAAQAQQSNAALLDKAVAGDAAAGSGSCGAPAGMPQGQSSVQKLSSAVAGAICGAGGWIQAEGTAMRAYGNTDVAGYGGNTAGFLAGIGKAVNNAGLRLGIAVGYDETALQSAGSKGTVDTTRVGLFGAQALGNFTIAGDFMFGASNTNTNRATGAGEANSSHAGEVFSGGLQVSTALQLAGISLVPAAGIRIAAVNAGGFDESGNAFAAPFTVAGASSGYDSVQPYVTIDISRAFLTPSGIAIRPDASLGYLYEAGSRGRAVTLQARDGTAFASQDIVLAGSAAQASAGISAGRGNWSLYARYSAEVAGNWVSQTADAGLRVRF